jgi:hypothetical protein
VLADLKMVVGLIRDAFSGFAGFRSKKVRAQAILELLCIYFVLVDVVTEGRTLLEAVGTNPRTTIAHAPDVDRAALLSEWHGMVCRQATRLYTLSGRLLGQDALAVFGPELKARLESVVSSKFKRVKTLHGIGAGLVMYRMFGDAKDQEWNRNVILSIILARVASRLI